MRILFIGGTGVISIASTRLAIQRGIDLVLLNRGQRQEDLPSGVQVITADMNDPASVSRALDGQQFDAVVNWIAFNEEHVRRDLELFRNRTKQYIFISSASAYQKPPAHYLITEETPMENPFWEYSRHKIAAEQYLLKAFRAEGFPAVIVRPSLTYGETLIPLVLNSWRKSYTIVDRMKRRGKVIVPGDGNSLWTITHNTDFAKGLVGLLGNPETLGEAFHITSDEVLTWNQHFRIVANTVGVEPEIVHIASDYLIACQPDYRGSLIGDKSVSVVFDNSKIRKFVPEYQATVSFAEGIRRALEWFDKDPVRREIDEPLVSFWDKVIAGYEAGLARALA